MARVKLLKLEETSGAERERYEELVMSNWKPQSQATPTGRFKEKNL